MTNDDHGRPATDSIHSELSPGMSRRRLLSSLTGVGFSQMTARFLTQEDLSGAASDQVPIVVGLHRDDQNSSYDTHTRNVPADWYNDYRHATQLKDRLESTLGEMEGVMSVGVEPGELGGDNSRLIVRMAESEINRMLGEVPTEVEGVEIAVESVSGFRRLGCRDDLRNWPSSRRSIHGGYEIQGDASAPIGTTGAAAFKNGQRYLATCQHIFRGKNVSGRTLKHPDGTPLGTVKMNRCMEDYAMVKLNSNYRVDRSIRHSGYNGVTGHFTYDGLGRLKSQGKRTQKVGRTTCRTSFAKIQTTAETIYTAPGCVPKPYSVFHKDDSGGADLKRGDSGSISFHQSPNNSNKCWLVSFINYEDSNTDDVFGIGLYRLTDFGFGF